MHGHNGKADQRQRRKNSVLTAKKYLGSVGIGATSPQLFRADDGNMYVVKLQNNRLGAKVLVNEYVACWFGRHMGLCFPPGDLIEIDGKMHFASQYLHKNRYVSKYDLQKAVNKSAMAGVILFDHLFHNIDRAKNRRNLLVCQEGGKDIIYAIDNSHLFVRGRWSIQSLEKLSPQIRVNRRRAYGWLLTHFLIREDFIPYVTKIKSLTDKELALLAASIPKEWLPLPKEREALFQYMVTRRNMVDDIMTALYQSIPNIDGGSHLDQRK